MATETSILAAWARCLAKLRCPSSGWKNVPWGTRMPLVPPSLRAGASVIKREAIERGALRTLRSDGLEKVLKGVTTIDEVVRETVLEDVE